ncbi:PP_RS20740 family protein [Streptomyces sp. NPDC001984]
MTEEVTGSDESDDLQALLGAGPVDFPEKVVRDFQPWHRPRKQYVRRAQWCHEIWDLASHLKRAKGELHELRYLTLPGNDLLDIRHIAETVCSPRQVKLRYLGFNSAAIPTSADQSELNGAEFSTIRMDWIESESQVFPGDFRRVADIRSLPYRRMRQQGPYHAINIDLCGGFAGREKTEGAHNYFDALRVILQNQARSDDDFLLFITTRMDDDNVDDEKKKVLLRLAQEIHDTCHRYASAFVDLWGVQEGDSPVHVPEIVDTGEAFMLGLTQWIISSGVSFGLKASVRSFMTYRTGYGPGEDDIVSLAIRFKLDHPVIPPDPHKLGKTLNTSVSQTEKRCEQSAIVPRRVRERTRVDEILKEKAEEFERCIVESAALLGSAGYDPNSYRGWVMQEEGLN